MARMVEIEQAMPKAASRIAEGGFVQKKPLWLRALHDRQAGRQTGGQEAVSGWAAAGRALGWVGGWRAAGLPAVLWCGVGPT